MSAAFSSRSSRFGRESAMQGPVPGDYNPDEYNSMAASARTRTTPRGGAFGGSGSRQLPWQKLPDDVPRGTSPSSFRSARSSTPRSEEVSKLPSTFGSANKGVPSAAFSGRGDRFATKKMATPGPGEYTSGRVPLSPSKRMNRSSSFNSKSKRFASIYKEEGPGPGEFDAKPSAFAPSSHRQSASAGFGSRSARMSPFASSQCSEGAAPGPEYMPPSDFMSRNDTKASTSAAFSSRSKRFGKTHDQGTSDPGSYDSGFFHSMARNIGKSFNKASTNGMGGFGSSQRRPAQMPGGKGAHSESPGPAAYGTAASRGAFSMADSKPSAAFASKSEKHGYVRATAAPSGSNAYNPDDKESMVSKSFNRRSCSFGSRAHRELTRATSTTPGPGSYERAEHDPLRPTCLDQAKSANMAKGGWGATTAKRSVDPAAWQTAAQATARAM